MKNKNFNLFIKYILTAACFSIALIISSWTTPINEEMFLQVKDEMAPGIIILSPIEGSSYAATVIVTGIVTDSATSDGGEGGIGSLSYEVMGTSLAGDITPETDGSFTFNFPTTNLSGSIVIQITASDWNGNEITESLTLVNHGAIPSFTIEPGNGEVTLSWDPVSMAESYTIYYEKNDILPSEAYSLSISNASSPRTLDGLVNGDMHVFQLCSHSSSGTDNWSEIVKVIPLSTAHLVPKVIPEFTAINTEWTPVSSTEEYEVWKSTSRNGPFFNISGVIAATSFRDTSVAPGQVYYYAVKPASYNDTLSGANAGVTTAFRPPNERIIGSVNTPGDSCQLAISGSYAYVADGDFGLRILDITTPEAPVSVGSLIFPSAANDVAVHKVDSNESYAYVTTDDHGLRIVDISNPSSPVERSSVFHSDMDCNMAVAAHHPFVYVADDSSGMRIIDVTDPDNPQERGFRDEFMPYDIAVDWPYVYSMEYWALAVIDVTNPDSPTVEGYNDSDLSFAEGLTVSGDYAYVADPSDLQIFNISSHTEPGWEGSVSTSGSAETVAVDYPLVYMADGAAGLQIINVSDPVVPIVIGSYNTPGFASDVKLLGNNAFVADGSSGLQIIDISSPASIHPVGFLSIDVDQIKLADPYAYLPSGVLNIPSPDSPTIAGTFPSSGTRMALNGSYVYTTGGTELRIVDISIPATPVEKGSLDIGVNLGRLAFSGAFAYVAGGDLRIVNIADPNTPTEVGAFITTGGTPVDIVVRYPYAYVLSGYDLDVIDISSASAPLQIGNVGLPWSVSLTISGTTAYASKYWGGFSVIDISDPENPVKMSEISTTPYRYSLDIAVSEVYVFLASKEGSDLRVYDVTNPVNPVEVAALNVIGTATAVEVSGRYVYLGAGGLHVLDLLP